MSQVRKSISSSKNDNNNDDAAVETDDDEIDSGQESPTWSLGDILQSLESSKQKSEFLIARANDLVCLLQRHPLIKYDLAMAQVGDRIRILLLHKRTEVVAAGYRVARYAITDLESIRNIRELQTDYLIIRTLTKDSKSQIERVQAVKFIRSFLDLPGGVYEISIGLIRALVAVAEHNEDKLRIICIETLAEIFIQHPEIVCDGGGVRIILQSIVEGPYELSVPMAMTIIYSMDTPGSRKLLRDGRDLDYLVSAFTDFQIRGHVHSEKLHNSAKVLSYILRTWSGLYALSADNFSSLRTLVKCMKVPVPALRDVLMDLFFSLFRIKPLSWSSSFLAGRRLTTFGRVPDLSKEPGNDENRADEAECPFVDHYSSLLLQIFIKCKLVETLVHIIEKNDDEGNARKATLLLSEILSMSGKLLPSQQVEKISTLPELFTLAMDGKDPDDKALASGAIFQIDKISRNIHKTRSLEYKNRDFSPSKNTNGDRSNQVKVKMGVQMDDASFKQLLMDTQVLNTKTYTKWNWEALSELIHGPLLNPRRLEEAIKSTKFMKRLISFYRPFKYRFSSIKRTKPNQKYVDVGRDLLNTLLYNQEGVKYLTENKLLRQIAECLAQLDPMSGITSPEPLFSSQRLSNTLSYGYFTLLGTLSADPNGMLMMERWRMFNMFYHLSELSSREDLIRGFIESMDYSLQGHPRIILAKTLTTAQREVRLFATGHLRKLLKTGTETEKWAIRLLVTQLYDPDVEVCKLAVEVLEAFCEKPENLEHFVKLQPSLDHLGDIGTPLLLRFLSTSSGFKYLKDLDYVNREMDNWFHGQNDNYVVQIEEYLECVQTKWVPNSSTKHEDNPTIMFPRHFYGELTLTTEGCQLLQSKGHFDSFVEYIHQHKDECEDKEVTMKVKGCLWAVGNIGSNPNGVPFLEDCNVTADVISIAENSGVCSLKGTAFFVLGLISSTDEGMEILDEFKWDSVLKIMESPRGITSPYALSQLFHNDQIDNTNADNDGADNDGETGDDTLEEMSNETEKDFGEGDSEVDFPQLQDPIKRKIIHELSNLSNQILANDASKQLVKLEAKHGDRFQSVEMFLEAMKLLEQYRYKLPVRRFIFELFDTAQLLEKMTRKTKKTRGRHSSDNNNNNTMNGNIMNSPKRENYTS